MMGPIYSLTDRTLIWLSEASELIDEVSGLPVSDLGLEYLSRMAQQIREADELEDDPFDTTIYKELRQKGSTYVPGSTIAPAWFLGLVNVRFLRRWWSRVWVIQEVALANRAVLICGDATADFGCVDALMANFTLHNFITHDDSDDFLSKATKNQTLAHCFAAALTTTKLDQHSAFETFRLLLEVSGEFKCSDARDKIFGLLGFFTDHNQRNVLPVVDYTKSANEVLTDTAICLITARNNSDILLSCKQGKREEIISIVDELSTTSSSSIGNKDNNLTRIDSTTLPSWVPDWYDGFFSRIIFSELFKKGTKPLYSFSEDHKLLIARGKLFEPIKSIPVTLAAIDEEFSKRTTAAKSFRTMKHSVDLGSKVESYPSREAVQQALTRTLCWNHPPTMELISQNPDEFFRDWCAIFDKVSDHSAERWVGSTSNTTAKTYYGLVKDLMPDFTLYITVQGYFGLIPHEAKQGDIIVFLADPSVPLTLRSVNNMYRLIEPAYIDCHLSWEAFPDDDISELTSFTLCYILSQLSMILRNGRGVS
jgi:hypothetical protein